MISQVLDEINQCHVTVVGVTNKLFHPTRAEVDNFKSLCVCVCVCFLVSVLTNRLGWFADQLQGHGALSQVAGGSPAVSSSVSSPSVLAEHVSPTAPRRTHTLSPAESHAGRE